MDSSLVSLFLGPEPPPAAELKRRLAPLGFRDPQKAWRMFSSVGRDPADRDAWAGVLPQLLAEFSKAPDPDLAANHFAAFAEASVPSSRLFECLARLPQARQVLARVLGLSPALASTLIQDPGLLYWLFDGDGLYAKFNPGALRETLERETAAAGGPEGILDALRRVKRRWMLRLAARDLMGLADVREWTFELSGLADALLESALQQARSEWTRAQGPPPPGSLAVIGMGKLGGRELNYNSDIDLLFVYEDGGGDPERARRYFNDLAERVIGAMTQAGPGGNLFRVDLRLRPEGTGDAARSLESCLSHYEERSQPWELQALLKARPCAGDLKLGRKFLGEVEPFIFRKNFDAVYLREMREIMDMIKRKMEARGREKTQVKLGRGGIREIEFIVQFLQLIHGGRDPEVRTPNTLEALERLGEKSFLLKADAQALAESYRFLRNVEHRLQMVHGLQTHTLPGKAADKERLARSLGFRAEGGSAAGRKFQARYNGVTRRVRALYEEVFRIRARRDPSARVAEDTLAGDREALARRLEKSFFSDPGQAAVNLGALCGRLKRTAGARGERLWTAFVPELFAALRKAPHPDRALNQLENFLGAASLPDLYLRYLLERPALLGLLLELFSNSLFLSEALVAQPGNFDIVVRSVSETSPRSVQDLLDPLEDLLAGTPGWEERLNLIRDTRNSEILRVGLQDLLGKRGLFDVFGELSRLAVALSRAALGVAADEMGLPRAGEKPSIPKGFCLFAVGKLGAREMNYGSDLDLLFIYGDAESREVGFENYLGLSATFTRVLSEPTRRGSAYRVDARLRPMGREAQMVHSVGAYRQYFDTYAQAAERLAYTRAVFLAGDRKTGGEAKEQIERFVYARGLTRTELDSMLDIRGRMEGKAQKAKGLEIKVSPGGIVDVEFLVQILQVAYGKDKPLLRMPHVPTVMGYLKEEGILPAEAADELLEAYRFYRLLEARHRMVRETSDDDLPEDPERLSRLAWRAGLGRGNAAARQVAERIEKTKERVRALFQRLPEWVCFE